MTIGTARRIEMSDMIGKFGRFWDAERPSDKTDYVYGYIVWVMSDQMFPMRCGNGISYECFEPAETEPTFPDPPRRLIKDRARLARVLLDGGWVPGGNGHFWRRNSHTFLNHMWALCGMLVTINHYDTSYILRYDGRIYNIEPEWTEPDDD